MLRLFTTNITTARPILTNLKLENYLDKFNKYIDVVINYYNNTHIYVNRPNKLVDLINSLPVKVNSSIEDIIFDLQTNEDYLLKHFGIASDISKSKVFKNTILNNTKEFYISMEIDIDDITYNNYKDISTVKCVYHNLTEIGPFYPQNSKTTIKDFTTAIYEIDVVALGIQFYYWLREQYMLDNDTDIARFVATIVIPNTIKSITNYSLINRYILNMEKDPNISKIPIDIPDFTDKLDREYEKLVDRIFSFKKEKYEDYLFSIPLIESNVLEVLKFNNTFWSSNNKWILWYSRIDIIKKLLSLSKDAKRINNKWISYLKLELRNAINSNIISRVPDDEIELILEIELNNLLKETK